MQIKLLKILGFRKKKHLFNSISNSLKSILVETLGLFFLILVFYTLQWKVGMHMFFRLCMQLNRDAKWIDVCSFNLETSIPKAKIPNYGHFVFGLQKNFGGKSFTLLHYLAILTSIRTSKFSKVFFHYRYLPKGLWFRKTKELVVLHRVRGVPKAVYSKEFRHFAQIADFVRLLL